MVSDRGIFGYFSNDVSKLLYFDEGIKNKKDMYSTALFLCQRETNLCPACKLAEIILLYFVKF